MEKKKIGRPPVSRPTCAYCHLYPVKRKRDRYHNKACANAARGQSLIARLDSLLIPGPEGACWEWTGARDRDGYGVITGDAPDRRQYRVPRLIWERAHGPLPHGQHVRHTCDNPPCWNPAHLRAGTNAENIAEKVARGRSSRDGGYKLTPEQVRQIRHRLSYGATLQTVAEEFKVGRATIWQIKSGRIWKDLS